MPRFLGYIFRFCSVRERRGVSTVILVRIMALSKHEVQLEVLQSLSQKFCAIAPLFYQIGNF